MSLFSIHRPHFLAPRRPLAARLIRGAAFAVALCAGPAASLAQNLPVSTASGPSENRVEDVIVFPDGSRILSGSYLDEVSVGRCPGTGCLSVGGTFGGFIARVDPDGNAVWLQNIAGGSVGQMVMADDTIYAIGGRGGTGTVSIGSASLVSTSLPIVFIVAIDGSGTLQWVAGAQGDDLRAFHLDVIGRDEPEYVVLAGTHRCGFSSFPDGVHTLGSDCSQERLLLGAVKLRGQFADPGQNSFFNEDWQWLTEVGKTVVGEAITGVAGMPSAVVHVSTATGTGDGLRLLRVANALSSSPIVSKVFDLPPALRLTDLAAIDDSALVLAGWHNVASDFGFLPAARLPGGLIGRLDVSNVDAVALEWLTSVPGGVVLWGATATDGVVYGVGSFTDTELDTVESVSGPTTLRDEHKLTSTGFGGGAGLVLSLAADSGDLRTAGSDAPWIFGGDSGSYRLSSGVRSDVIHTDGLGRVAIGGDYPEAAPGPVIVGTEQLPMASFIDGFAAVLSANGTPVSSADWVVGQALVNPAAPILTVADRPLTFRSGMAFDAYAEGYFYFDPPDPMATDPAGRVIPISASAEPIEIVWDPNGASFSETRSIRWPEATCSTNGYTPPCAQRHVVGAPVELNSASHAFRQLYTPPENAAAATADPAAALFNAETAGYSVVRYEGNGGELMFEIVRSDSTAAVLTGGPPRVVAIGQAISAPQGYPHQPGRPGHVLNPRAYVDGTGSGAAYDRSRRRGQVIPVNRNNPVGGEQSLQIAWYRGNGKGVFWPERVDAYEPRWPDDARGLIISAIEFSPADAGAPSGCSGGATVRLFNTRTAEQENNGVIDLLGYSLQTPEATVTGTSFPVGPGQFTDVTLPLCRDQWLVLKNGEIPVDHFGEQGVIQAWAGGPVAATDMLLVRNNDVCLGNAARANPFLVGFEWSPAQAIGEYEPQCTEKIIIASQGGSEVSGRDFPTDLLISQYVEDGPPVDSDGDGVLDQGQDQVIELYNGSAGDIDISAYDIELHRFGSGPTATITTIPLTGPNLPPGQTHLLPPGQTHVLGHPGNRFRDEGLIDQVDAAMVIDGNDAVVLRLRGGGVIDAFGANENPGTQWTSEGVSSLGSNLLRSDRVCDGAAFDPGDFDPHEQWRSDAIAGLVGVGSHGTDCVRVQPPLDPARYIDWTIYAQADRMQLGFNPNDEHALKASSRIGSGFQAAFALRADFGEVLGRDDMNDPIDTDNASEPYVLVRYQQPADRRALGLGPVGFRVFKVAATVQGEYEGFVFESTAGFPIFAPYPLSNSGNCAETRVDGESPTGDRIPPAPFFRDYTNQLWARSANRPGRDAIVRYHYPLADGFYFDDVRPGLAVGECAPWMPNLPAELGGSGDDEPIATRFDIGWPDRPLQLLIGESLIDAKRGLPSIRQQASVQVVFDEIQEKALEDPAIDFDPRDSLVEYFDPLETRGVDLTEAQIPGLQRIPEPASGLEILAANAGGYKLPFSLRSRLRFDPVNNRLLFGGLYREGGNDPLLLTNILSDCEAQHLIDFPAIDPAQGFDCGDPKNPSNAAWNAAIDRLVRESRNPNGINHICPQVVRGTDNVLRCATAPVGPVPTDEILVGYTDNNDDGILERYSEPGVPGVLSAGAAMDEGFVTIALNNDPQLSPQPIELKVIRIGCLDLLLDDQRYRSPYQGRVHVIESDGVFDETLALRHSGDFAGRLDQVEFEWCIAPDNDSRPPQPPDTRGLSCTEDSCVDDPDSPFSCGAWKTFEGDPAAPEVSIGGASSETLSDNWIVARYRFKDRQGNYTRLCEINADQPPTPNEADVEFGLFAGSPGGTPREPLAQLAEGWIKRVVDRLNPFDTRVRDFHAAETNTLSSLIAQLGERFEGDIPLVSTPDNLNSLGFIEAYETVLRRALQFIYGDGGSNSPGATGASNNAILLISTRLADLYTALANEAYADALDPLVGLTRPVLGTIATETFNFENQLASLLEEELVLLRGRDNTQGSVTARPVYNRLYPNFTGAEGQAAYALAYNITDRTGPDGEPDSIIDEEDALALFPQGHGDAWGHLLQAMSYHYDLLRRGDFDWKARTENVIINGGPLPVDYVDERKFAANAALKARVGAEIVDLTYRDFYTEDPDGQWQGYKDNRLDRQWGVSGWASRAGGGAYLDWLTANSILPPEHRPLAFSPEFVGTFCGANPGDPFCACLNDPDADCDTPSTGFRDFFCALPENAANAYCDCIDDNGTRICPLDFPARGIQVIERGNVAELDEILDRYLAVQTQIDEVNRGLNPLGISRDAVPFDIDPSRVDRNETHFEQVAERASSALENAAQVWDFANRLNEMLRFNQDSVEDLEANRREAEFDFTNRLLDIFGSPFPNRIGAGRTYPDNYGGPDLLHYMEVALPALSGSAFGLLDAEGDPSPENLAPGYDLQGFDTFYARTAKEFTDFDITGFQDQCASLEASNPVQVASECAALLNPEGGLGGANSGSTADAVAAMTTLSGPDIGVQFVNTGGGNRRVTGSLQQAVQDALNARIEFAKAVAEYDAHLFDIQAFVDQFTETYRIRGGQLALQSDARDETLRLTTALGVAKGAASGLRALGGYIKNSFDSLAECGPRAVGLAVDVTSFFRCGLMAGGDAAESGFGALAESVDIISNSLELAKEDVGLEAELAVADLEAQLELIGISGDLSSAIEHEPVLRLEVTRRAQDVQAAQTRIANLLADGQTILVEREIFRRKTASAVSDYRFRDIAFRQYRNEVVQKYRATFDLAARFVYLAAKAYDYETNLLGSDSRAGQAFLTDIVRHRTIGQLLDGVPIAGSNGLTDSLGRMQANFQVLKGQMGFNNPQIETNRFSLRRELFDIDDPADDERWRERLTAARVLDLNTIPEFRRLARPFADVGSCPQPGLVIEFFSSIRSGSNFFGGELEALDSAYDSSKFATKIRGVGAWFADYDGATLGLSETPRVYLLPVGEDVLRPANGLRFDTRLWKVVDQVIPVPFAIGENDIARPEWNPGSDSLSDAFALERRIGQFRAFPFSELGFDQQFSTDSRLIGRSVWNSRWLLIIPGASLLGDPDEGLDRFIHGENIPGTFWESDTIRDGYPDCTSLSTSRQGVSDSAPGGVSDILLFFRTYAYSGN